MRRTDPDMLAKLRLAFADGGNRRPPLYRWMASNYDELMTLFNDARVNWARLTESFREGGFVNGAGGDLQPEIVRQTWYRVRKRRTRKPASRPATVEVLSSPASIMTPPPAAVARPSPPTPSPTSPTGVKSSTEALADVLAEMNRRSGRI